MNMSEGDTIRQILEQCRTIAVVGASSNPARASNHVASYMKAQGYRVIPVNPNEQTVVGEPAYPSLTAVPGSIDLVDIFASRKMSCRSLRKPLRLERKRSGCRRE
jgi:hypothetical protein